MFDIVALAMGQKRVLRNGKHIMKQPYTCNDYRQEMILVGLKRQLADPKLDPAEKKRIEAEVQKLEAAMGMD